VLYGWGRFDYRKPGAFTLPIAVDAQCEQVFTNIEIALLSQGASWKNVVAFTTYVVGAENLAVIGAYRARRFPTLFGDGSYPPNTLLIVERLAQPECKIEIQTIAALDK